MIRMNYTDPNGVKWTAEIDYDGHTRILRNGSAFDTGWDCGQLIHHTKRTPRTVLDGFTLED